MNFKKWNKIIEELRGETIDFEIYYSLCLNFEHIEEKDLAKLISIIKEAYLKDENRLDLSFICDVAWENKNEILNNEDFTKWDLLEKCGEAL